MSNARKLQTEIDRVMKKVDEGVELFDDIWEKVYSAEQQNQKEKYEMDLKKEIKKLQRLRDQIKTWISSSDVKDKEPLLEARRLIETKMEQFKICEKETKTKTYSKEGLARAEKLDPAEEAKMKTTQWIGDYVSKLQQLVEDREVEIERLMAGKGKKTNKHIIEDYNQFILNHKFHVNKLEGIMRLVNNDVLDVDAVDALKEDLDYYMDSYEDEDYQQAYDEEFFYDALGLDDLDVVNVDRVTNIAAPVKKKEDDAASSSTKGSKDKKTTKKSALSSVIPLTIGRARVSSTGKSGSTGNDKDNNSSHSSKDFIEPTTIPAAAPTASKGTPSKSGGRTASTGAAVPTPSTIPQVRSAVPAAGGGGGTSMAAILKRETEQQEKERQKARAQAEQLRQQQQQQLQRQQQEALRQQQQQEALQRQQQQQEAALRQQQQQQEALRQQQQQEAAAKQIQQQQAAQQAPQAHQQAAVVQQTQQQAADKKQQQLQAQIAQGSTGAGGAASLDILSSGLGGLNLAGVVGMDGAAAPGSAQNGPAGVISSNVTSSGSGSNSSTPGGNGGFGASGAVANDSAAGAGGGSSYLTALNDGFATMPNATDNERSRQYSPQNPYPTPSSYPSSPSGIFDNPAIFEKLGTDCLFFIFYYAQGTYQQYLAARELKKQSWRFHKKYMTWFQRHEEPKVTTDEYEQGTYVYFDYETGWCTRIKTDFRFEYSYLEDSLQ